MMTRGQQAAYVFSQSTAALAEIEGMKAANLEREHRGFGIAYDEESFFSIIAKYELDRDSIRSILQ